MAVYLVRCGDAVKIGYAREPAKRIPHIQTTAPGRLTTLQIMEGDRNLERALHKHFASSRLSGEWFQYSPEMEKDLSWVLPVKLDRPKPPEYFFDMSLKKVIRARGILQQDIAAELGVSTAAVSKWANGIEVVPHDLMRPLASMIGIDVVTLIPKGASRRVAA